MTQMITITGNTYPVKDKIKALGGRWNPAQKGWDVPIENAAKARALLPATKEASTFAPSGWLPCGYPNCSPAYCDECDGEGAGTSARWRRR